MKKYKDHISSTEFKSLKSEHDIMNECMSWLRAHDYWCTRMNSGVISQTDKNGRQRRIWMGKAGTPDLMAFKEFNMDVCSNAKAISLLFIEVKRPGQVPTFNQKEMMEELESYGSRCLVIHSIDELEELI